VLSRWRASRRLVHVLTTDTPLRVVRVLRRRDTLVMSTIVSLVAVECLASVLWLLLVGGIVLHWGGAVLRRRRHVAAAVVAVLVRGCHPTSSIAWREAALSPAAGVDAAYENENNEDEGDDDASEEPPTPKIPRTSGIAAAVGVVVATSTATI